MAIAFKYFVIFAEMRTGSNFLQSHLNKFPDLHCFGELFNPVLLIARANQAPWGFQWLIAIKTPFRCCEK
jgi:hypothetical protein